MEKYVHEHIHGQIARAGFNPLLALWEIYKNCSRGGKNVDICILPENPSQSTSGQSLHGLTSSTVRNRNICFGPVLSFNFVVRDWKAAESSSTSVLLICCGDVLRGWGQENRRLWCMYYSWISVILLWFFSNTITVEIQEVMLSAPVLTEGWWS